MGCAAGFVAPVTVRERALGLSRNVSASPHRLGEGDAGNSDPRQPLEGRNAVRPRHTGVPFHRDGRPRCKASWRGSSGAEPVLCLQGRGDRPASAHRGGGEAEAGPEAPPRCLLRLGGRCRRFLATRTHPRTLGPLVGSAALRRSSRRLRRAIDPPPQRGRRARVESHLHGVGDTELATEGVLRLRRRELLASSIFAAPPTDRQNSRPA